MASHSVVGWKNLQSAAFISDSLVVVAAADGLILVDIEASAAVTRINYDRHADVYYSNDTIYSLNVTKKSVQIFMKVATWWMVKTTIALHIGEIHTAATMLV